MNGTAPPIHLQGVNYSFGRGALQRQILFDIDVAVQPGEIVILTGPSGSGKTTLLTLIGALRSAQEGSLQVLGRELRKASQRHLMRTRRQIGYIFQSHNLLKSLTISQNVQMAARLAPRSQRAGKQDIRKILERVGLGEHIHSKPATLSGGQKQRAGIARALVNRPRIVLADEPTASLDKQSGRDVVELIQDLAHADGTAVVLVTHDNRILDIADRILHLEDGRLKSASEAVVENTSRMLNLMQKHSPTTAGYLAAFAFALARVAYADRVVVESEREVVRRVLAETADLTESEIDFILQMSLLQGLTQTRNHVHPDATDAAPLLDEARREHFRDSLHAIASADGEITADEALEINRIAAEYGL